MNEINKIKIKAEQLYQTRKAIVEIEEEAKKHTDELKATRDTLNSDLITLLDDAGLSSIKISSGENYSKAIRKGVVVNNPFVALQWAQKNSCVKVDSILSAQKIKKMDVVPDGFEATEVSYISIRKPKQED